MEKIHQYAVGLMSGTSLDGLDICYAEFLFENNQWHFNILQAETLPYEEDWYQQLNNAIKLSGEELMALHSEYGFYLGKKVKNFIQKNKIQNVDVIASHGQTIFHQPNRKFTTQIGDGRAIKIETGIPVIYDFRSQDVLLGGNGAPLVPIGDEYLFAEYDACLNLGGFSNISLRSKGKRIAFDICPVNVVLNYFAQKFSEEYDEGGNFARQGEINYEQLEQLNQLEFYQQKHPKSLGMEWVNEFVIPVLTDSPENNLATFTEHIAVQISNTINAYKIKKILITGGGTYNSYLIEKLKEKTKAEIIIPTKEIINFKEALIFAFMGVLRLNGLDNVLSSATGSKANHSSGIIA